MRRCALPIAPSTASISLWCAFRSLRRIPRPHPPPPNTDPNTRASPTPTPPPPTVSLTTAVDTAPPDGSHPPSPPTDFPDWPLDETEFNTRAPSGGHLLRLAHDPEAALSTGLAPPEASVCAETPPPLCPAQLEALRRAEQTAEGVAARLAGGWVCAVCGRCNPHRSRSVCADCHTLRHDAADTVARWRKCPTNWVCVRCREFNFERDAACRCCRAVRDAQLEMRAVQHERVTDEVARAAVGSVIVTKNRVSRWRCMACAESNTIQSVLCRNCSQGRFQYSVGCATCGAQTALSSARMYGVQPNTAQPFGQPNCFPRLAPEQRCVGCRASLHGALASARSDAWLCGCGMVNNAAVVSCPRCRLPRRLGSPAALEELLRVWDFAGCTNWYCEGCGQVNKASRHVVALDRHASAKTTRVVRGVAQCERCGLPWHHQSVGGGKHWRCACHKVNRQDETRCAVCMLPAADGIRTDVLSFWTRGDWYCFKCLRQNYREKSLCACGEARAKEETI